MLHIYIEDHIPFHITYMFFLSCASVFASFHWWKDTNVPEKRPQVDSDIYVRTVRYPNLRTIVQQYVP